MYLEMYLDYGPIHEPQMRGYGGGLFAFAVAGGCRLHLRQGVFEFSPTDPTPSSYGKADLAEQEKPLLMFPPKPS